MKELVFALLFTVAASSVASAQDQLSSETCVDCPRMVTVNGDDIQGIAAFAVSRTEITFNQWAACAGGGGCQTNPNPADAGWGRGNRPVINVSWNDAREYLDWLSRTTGQQYRLLTEEEWEFAARTFPDSSLTGAREPSGDFAWTTYNAADRSHPVGQKSPNSNGLYDMWGNVWEWVDDCFNPRCSQRVLRGGSYNYAPRQLRANSRNASNPNDRSRVIGFRVATAPQEGQ